MKVLLKYFPITLFLYYYVFSSKEAWDFIAPSKFQWHMMQTCSVLLKYPFQIFLLKKKKKQWIIEYTIKKKGSVFMKLIITLLGVTGSYCTSS